MIKMKSRINRLSQRLLALFLALTFILTVPLEIQDNCSTDRFGITIAVSEVSAADSITVTSANNTTVKKIHQKLSKGKAINLKVKGDSNKSKKLLNSVKTKIKKVNKQGVVFEASKAKTTGGYTYYTVSSDQAGTYQYAVKYIQKLYKLLRNAYKDGWMKDYFKDVKKYPDENTRKLHWVYDKLVNSVYSRLSLMIDEETSVKIDKGTWDEQTTSTDAYLKRYDYSDYEMNKQLLKNITYSYTAYIDEFYSDRMDGNKKVVLDYNAPLDQQTKEAVIEQLQQEAYARGARSCFVFIEDESVHASALSFAEFSATKAAQKLIKDSKYFETVPDTDMLIYKTTNFCELSDAMKIYAISMSGYFNCNFGRPKFGMVYDYTWKKYYGKNAMKILYNNKAVGVCEVFATYEKQVWDALGITNYFCASGAINHAWTVVKVKNSAGKVLWIPFDYGIGPAEGLAVDSATYNKYLRTEAMRYKLYLKDVKGAPKKKNFTDKDFK